MAKNHRVNLNSPLHQRVDQMRETSPDAREAFQAHLDSNYTIGRMTAGISSGVYACHGSSYAAGWYQDPKTNLPLPVNVGEKLMLIVSEISEAMEAHRKDLMDDKLPHRPGMEVELADAVIRIFDLSGAMGLDLAGAVAEKMAYNARRADHSRANRVAEGGKAY